MVVAVFLVDVNRRYRSRARWSNTTGDLDGKLGKTRDPATSPISVTVEYPDTPTDRPICKGNPTASTGIATADIDSISGSAEASAERSGLIVQHIQT